VGIEIEHREQRVPGAENGHDDLGSGARIARNVARERVHIRNDQGALLHRGHTADPFAEFDLEAPHGPLVGPDAKQAGRDDPIEARPARVRKLLVHQARGGRHGRDRVANSIEQACQLILETTVGVSLFLGVHEGIISSVDGTI